MEDVLAIGIAWMLLSAATAYVVGDRRSFTVALIAAAAIVAFGGEAWVHGTFGAVLFSPLLFVTIPLARRMKRKKAGSGAGQDGPFPHSTNRAGGSPDATIPPDGRPSWKDIQAERDAERKAAQQKRVDDLYARVARDPVSAVLRRQVPVRFDEPARSWLGGLPRLPESVDWPRNTIDDRPMHFAAQICCADLPKELWTGRGPREGWLLLFVDAFNIGSGGPEDDECVCVLHVDHLGPERAPPEDLPPVQSTLKIGAEYWRPQEAIPRIWRKWPVDIVAQRQTLVTGQVIAFSPRDVSPNPTTSEELYGIPPREENPQLDPDDCPPLTWGGALEYIDWLMHVARKRSDAKITDKTADLRRAPGWLNTLIAEAEQEVAALIGRIPEYQRQIEEAEKDEDRAAFQSALYRSERYLRQERDTLERLRWYAENGGEDVLEAEITANVESYGEWWKQLAPQLENIRAVIARADPGKPLSAKTWDSMRRSIYGLGRPEYVKSRRSDRPEALHIKEMTLGGVAPWGGEIMRAHYLDLYTDSAETAALMPEKAKDAVGEIARALNWDRPHRIGGLMDPLQSDIDPADPPLLFQLASDDAMHWMWGDAGAIYVYAEDDDLETGRFHVSCRFECH